MDHLRNLDVGQILLVLVWRLGPKIYILAGFWASTVVHADLVAQLKLALRFLGWHARNLPSLRLVIHTDPK
jgi:hypothetical protein